jgi:molybdenum cofactor biosynthesis enzyme MoaA
MSTVKEFTKIMINDKNKDTWCVNAFHSMSGMNNGTTKLCCMHRPEERDMLLGKDSIDSILNKKEFKKIRKSLAKGERHPACTLCWQEEDAGRRSKRVRDNERYQHELKWKDREPYKGLAKVELNLGNTCNISCRTCMASVSSGWMKEEFQIYRKDEYNTFKDFAIDYRKYHMSYDDDSPFWQDIENHLPTIKQFDFYGGEPFMIKRQWRLLEKAVELGYSKDIELHYNTNGTLWPKEVELWKHFKTINLSFSIDGIGDQFEYMRYPAKWDIVQQNIENAIKLNEQNKNMSISWCITISNINIFDLHETINYWKEHYSHIGLYLNLVHRPFHFSIAKMPNEYKDTVIKILEDNIPKSNEKAWAYLDGIIEFIKQGTYEPDVWQEFLKRINVHDDYRGQDFKKTWPNLTKVLDTK